MWRNGSLFCASNASELELFDGSSSAFHCPRNLQLFVLEKHHSPVPVRQTVRRSEEFSSAGFAYTGISLDDAPFGLQKASVARALPLF